MPSTEYARGQALGRATFEETCPACGIRFAMPDEFERVRRLDHGSFYCPLGHSMSYGPGKTNLQLAQEARDRAIQRATHLRDQLDAAERSHSATKGQLTKARKRAANGVCPCCSRTFVDVQRHIASKHPDFIDTL